MKILVLNSGSSSLKFKLFLETNSICSGNIEKISEESSHITIKTLDETISKNIYIKDHKEALDLLFDILKDLEVVLNIKDLDAVGHRVVHGGEKYSKATLIDTKVLKELESLTSLAPLHNPANILGIQAILHKDSSIKQVAIFDTAFHQSMPNYAYTYALPFELYKNDKIRRYGFHGTSHKYILKESASILEKDINNTNIISLHLGNGASICAIQNGKSVDTSMGFTPLEGLVMGTRSGDLDPAIIFYLHNVKNYSLEKIDNILNKKSGLLGICGENDMRLILKNSKNNERYKLALDIFVYRIKKYIGSYMAILNTVDAIVFTGGIGENSAEIRELICSKLDIFSIHIDKGKNTSHKTKIHQEKSKMELLVIQTDEELEIALQTKELIHG